MSKKIFINNLDTYVSQAIFNELRNDGPDEEGNPNPDANVIFGTYIDKDSSIKPDGVTKMLKRSKPLLSMKYISGCDLIVYDLHSGNPSDVKIALEALNKYNSEDEKVLILISSLMAWDATPKKLQEIKEPGDEQDNQEEGAEGEEDNEENKEEEDGAEEQEEAQPSSNGDEQREEGEGEEGEEGASNQEQEEQKEEVKAPTPAPKRKKYLHLPFSEADYKNRAAGEEYAKIKQIEDLVLEFKKEGVKTYVISAGVLYGMGEAIFNLHFKKAWLQDPQKLPIVGEGRNLVPTIHVKDLARMVKKIYETKPESNPYIFGIDNTKRPTQKKLISAISNGIGTGLTESGDIPVNFKPVHPEKTPLQLDIDWRKFLLLNIKAKPSKLFVADAVQNEEDEEPADDSIEFDWHCKAGLASNIQLVKEEFCKERGLKPFKVLITGKPASGKSYFAQKLAEHYNVPHVHIERVLSEIQTWNKEKEEIYKRRIAEKERLKQLEIEKQEAEKRRIKEEKRLAVEKAERLRQEKMSAEGEDQEEGEKAKPQEESDDNIERDQEGDDKNDDSKDKEENNDDEEDEEQEQKEDANKKKKEEEEDSEEEFVPLDLKLKVNEFLANNSNEKIPCELILEAFRWRLNQNDCQNRGYVLDGFPLCYDTAKGVFYITPKRPEKPAPVINEDGEEEPVEEIDEEEMAKLLMPQFQKNIYPDSVIMIRGSDDYIRQRVEKMTEAQNFKWSKDNLERRLAKYNGANNIELFSDATKMQLENSNAEVKFPMIRFFQENKTEVFELDVDGDQFEMFESMRVYIERNGRSYNYLSSIKHLNNERETYLNEEENIMKDNNATKQQNENQDQEKKKEALEKLAEARIDGIMAHMQSLKETDKLNMRQFLMKNIIPVLTEGMIDVWKVGPLDPVDYLADYIFKKSNEMRK